MVTTGGRRGPIGRGRPSSGRDHAPAPYIVPNDQPFETPQAVKDKCRDCSVILTVSSFMSRGNRRAELLACVSSILARHAEDECAVVREIVVINEYDANRSEDFGPAVRALSPRIEFVQKGPDQHGQAHTLNMILDRIGGYEHWIHWEESFVCTRPFLARAIDVMLSTELTQLSLTTHWLNVGSDRLPSRITPAGTRHVQVLSHPRTESLVRETDVWSGFDRLINRAGYGAAWPLYSLVPSINRAKFCLDVGRFNEDPRLWPVKFEWDYGKRWLLRGATKGVLTPHAAEVQPNHVSTYK